MSECCEVWKANMPTFTCSCGKTIYAERPSVPRVAESLDDLRVGQTIVCLASRTGKWTTVDEYRGNWGEYEMNVFDRVVILSDPPPEPVTVSREAFDRLADMVQRTVNGYPYNGGEWYAAARMLVIEEARGADA